MIRTWSLSAVLVLGTSVLAQQPTQPASTATQPKPRSGATKPVTKSALEKAIDQAMASNPDLRVAEAKLREAEASLNRTRLQILQKVVVAHQALEEAKASAASTEKILERNMSLFKRGNVPSTEVNQSEMLLSNARAKVAAAQAELNYLIGKAVAQQPGASYLLVPGINQVPLASYYQGGGSTTIPQGTYDLMLRAHLATTALTPTSDRLSKALEQKITLKLDNVTARHLLDLLREKSSGLHLQAVGKKSSTWDEKVTAELSDVPFSAALQLLEDVLQDHVVVVREYGLLIAHENMVPRGATTLADFLRKAKGVQSTTPSSSIKPPPSTSSPTRKR